MTNGDRVQFWAYILYNKLPFAFAEGRLWVDWLANLRRWNTISLLVLYVRTGFWLLSMIDGVQLRSQVYSEDAIVRFVCAQYPYVAVVVIWKDTFHCSTCKHIFPLGAVTDCRVVRAGISVTWNVLSMWGFTWAKDSNKQFLCLLSEANNCSLFWLPSMVDDDDERCLEFTPMTLCTDCFLDEYVFLISYMRNWGTDMSQFVMYHTEDSQHSVDAYSMYKW